MKDYSDVAGTMLFIGIVLGCLIMGAAYGLPRVSLNAESWIGNKPFLEYLLGFFTVTAAFIAAIYTVRTFRMNAAAAVASRFQKAVELLGDGTSIGPTGGAAILADVASNAPRHYTAAVIDCLRSFVADRSAASWNAMWVTESANYVWPQSDPGVYRAMCTIFSIPYQQRFRHHQQRILSINRTYLGQLHFTDNVIESVAFRATIFKGVEFEDCHFRNVLFVGCRTPGDLVFTRCTFENVAFEMAPERGAIDQPGNIYMSHTIAAEGLTRDGDPVSATDF